MDDNDGPVHEAASTDTVCLSAGMLVSADEVSQTVALDKDKRAETISPGQYSRPRKSKSARIDDRIQHPWLRLMWVLVMMSL